MPLPLKKRWLVVLSLVLLAALVGWRLWTRLGDSGRGAGRARGAPVVAFAEVARRDLEETFQTVGTVESPQKVELSPKVPGRIEELEVHPGDRVRQGNCRSAWIGPSSSRPSTSVWRVWRKPEPGWPRPV